MSTSEHQNVILTFKGSTNDFIESRIASGFSQSSLNEALGIVDKGAISSFEAGVYSIDNRVYTLSQLIMNRHPRYEITQHSNHGELLITPPSGEEIRQTRLNANAMTQQKMAKLLGMSNKSTVLAYEKETRIPSIQGWTLFLLITSQHPYYTMTSTCPTISQKVFKGQPDWVMCAAVCLDGSVMGFDCTKDKIKPRMNKGIGNWISVDGEERQSCLIGINYDTSNWRESAINKWTIEG